jgi:type III secretion system YopN/LcrE/InvE/MxiC family regulator
MTGVNLTGQVSEALHRERTVTQQPVPEQKGNRNGEVVVVVRDPLSIVQSMQEEIGLLLSEARESEMSEDEREVSTEEHEPHVGHMGGTDDGSERGQKLPDLLARRQEIELIANAMVSQGVTDPDEIRQFVRENLGERPNEPGPNDDPTLQYGALAMIERIFAGAGNEEMSKAVRIAGDQLLSERALEINKGMIVSEAAALYSSERLGSVSDLRSLYLDQVVSHKGIQSSFNAILEKHGEKGFTEALAFLLRAAGDDLSTMTGSTDKTQQKEVLDNLYQLEVLNTVRERTDELLARLGKHFGVNPDTSSQKLMSETFSMLEMPAKMSESNITRIARESVPESVEGRISFLREYRGLVNLIPIKVLDGADPGGGGLRLRERFMDTIGQAQDVADDEEQQKLNAQ